MSLRKRGTDKVFVRFHLIDADLGLISRRREYSPTSRQNDFSSLRISTIVNLMFLSDGVRISTELASITRCLKVKGCPSVVWALIFTFLLRRLCLIVNVESGFSLNVRSNFFGFFAWADLRVLAKRLLTSFTNGILLYSPSKLTLPSRLIDDWLAMVLPVDIPSISAPRSQR